MLNQKKVFISIIMVLVLIMGINHGFAEIVINEFEVTSEEESINVTVSAKDETSGMAEHPYRVTVMKGEEEISNSDWVGENFSQELIDNSYSNEVKYNSRPSDRAIVQLDNGWLIYAMPKKIDGENGEYLWFYKSYDMGISWEQICYIKTEEQYYII